MQKVAKNSNRKSIPAETSEDLTKPLEKMANYTQKLIRRWDSERELLRSAPGSYPNSLK